MVALKSSVEERNNFARSHENLVRKIAHKMALQCREPWEDLFQIGYIGLLKAVDRFEPSRGNAFSSFAVPYIQGEIQHFLRDEWGAVRVPRRSLEAASKVRRVKRKLQALGAEVDETAVAIALQINPKKWQSIQQSVKGNLTVTLNEEVCAQMSVAALEVEPEYLAREHLYKELFALVPIQRSVVMEAFFAGLQLTTIARRRQMTIEQVSSVLQQGLSRLASCLRKNYAS